MNDPDPKLVQELDELFAPAVIGYIMVMMLSLVAAIAWVYWFRGYA